MSMLPRSAASLSSTTCSRSGSGEHDMRWWIFLAALTACSPAFAQVYENPSWPTGPDAVLPSGEYILKRDTVLEYDAITLQDGTTVTTAGYDLDIHIRQSFKVGGTVV